MLGKWGDDNIFSIARPEDTFHILPEALDHVMLIELFQESIHGIESLELVCLQDLLLHQSPKLVKN